MHEVLSTSSVATAPDVYSMACTDHDGSFDTAWYDVDAIGQDRCSKCGRKCHKQENCRTDMSKV